MATTYTDNSSKLVFLNDKNIASSMSQIDSIEYNAIPSLSLFNETYSKIELSAAGISAEANKISALAALSGEISSTATAWKMNDSGTSEQLSTKVKIVKLSNEAYNNLVINSQIEDNALYVIDDSYFSARGQQLKDIAAPTDLSDAVTKEYADKICADISSTADAFVEDTAETLSASLKAYVNEVSAGTKSLAYDDATALVNSTKAELNGTIALSVQTVSAAVNSSNFVPYDKVEFSYDSNAHYLVLTLEDLNGHTNEISVDSTDFIKNRIVDHIAVDEDQLKIYWKNATGSLEFIAIPLDALITVYDAGDGIDIVKGEAFTISCDSTIARVSQVTQAAAAAKADADALSDAIQTNVQDISQLEDLVDANAGNITALSVDLTALTTTVESTSATAQANRENVGTLSSDVSTLSTYAQTNRQNIEKLTAYVDELSSLGSDGILKGIDTRLTAIENSLSSTSDTTAVRYAVDQIAQSLAGVNSALGVSVLNLESSIGTVDSKAEAAKLSAALAKTTVDTFIANEYHALTGSIDTINGAIATLNNTVDTLNTNDQVQTGQITSLINDMTAAQQSINQISGIVSTDYATKAELTSLATKNEVSAYVSKQAVIDALQSLELTSTVEEVATALISLRQALAS